MMKRLLLLALLLLGAQSASAQGLTCNGRFEVSYPFLGGFVNVGDTVTMRLALGAGPVIGGSAFFTNNVDIELACSSDFPIVPVPCAQDPGKPVKYLGDQTITSNCTTCRDVTNGIPGVPTNCVFTSDNPGGGVDPNAVHFQLPDNVFLRIPENSPVPYCFVDIQVQVVGESGGIKSPKLIEQNSGYLPAPTPNCTDCFAVCDNFILASQVTQSSALVLGTPEAFQCYEAPRRDTHKPNVTVTVTDQFGSDSVVAQRIHPFCAPTNLNGADPLAPNNPVHNAGYVLGNVNSAAFAQPTVSANTVFGTFSLKVGTPAVLTVPTAKSVQPAPPPPPLVTPTNHYLCHRALNVSGPNVKGTSVTEQDQFITFTQKLSTVSCAVCTGTEECGADCGRDEVSAVLRREHTE